MQNECKLKCFKIDFSACTTLGEVYAVIQKELELPEWFGANLDALWDALVGIMYTPAQITVGKTVKNPDLLDDIARIIEVMHKAEEKYREITILEKNEEK